MFLSENLKYLRKKAGFSQDFIANMFGYKSFTTIQKWESGVSEPNISTVHKLCDLYNVAIDEIIYKNLANTSKNVIHVNNYTEYKMFPVSISAGCLEDIGGVDTYDTVPVADEIMGKYAGRKSVVLLKVNGESMNNVIPNGSYIVVDTSKAKVSDISDRDIVVFSENGSYSVKRYINDRTNERFLFKPDSSDDTFTAIEIKYEESTDLRLIGKVVKYIVNLD